MTARHTKIQEEKQVKSSSTITYIRLTAFGTRSETDRLLSHSTTTSTTQKRPSIFLIMGVYFVITFAICIWSEYGDNILDPEVCGRIRRQWAVELKEHTGNVTRMKREREDILERLEEARKGWDEERYQWEKKVEGWKRTEHELEERRKPASLGGVSACGSLYPLWSAGLQCAVG